MKKFYTAVVAAAAIVFSHFDASAHTVDEIAGRYNATNMNFELNAGAFMHGIQTLPGVSAVSWEMTISVMEGNRVKLTNFIKKGINYGMPSVDGVFDITGVFDPATGEITIEHTSYTYPAPGFPQFNTTTIIAKYDEVLELTEEFTGEYENFTAKFDSNKTLTVSPWAMYTRSKVSCIPTYNRLNKERNGTRFTYLGPAGVESVIADENAPVEYFNLQGVRVENPENGLYIRRQGSKVEKVMIR